MPKGIGYDLICPQCRESFHETTKSFDSEKDANSGMFKLKRQYTAAEGNQWDGFPPDPTAGYGFLECPQCGAQYAPSGRVEVREQEKPWSGIVDKKSSPLTMEILKGIKREIEPTSEDPEPITVASKGQFTCLHTVAGKPCLKVCKSKAGLVAHMRVHKK